MDNAAKAAAPMPSDRRILLPIGANPCSGSRRLRKKRAWIVSAGVMVTPSRLSVAPDLVLKLRGTLIRPCAPPSAKAVEAARAIEPLCMLWCIPGVGKGDWSPHAFKLL